MAIQADEAASYAQYGLANINKNQLKNYFTQSSTAEYNINSYHIRGCFFACNFISDNFPCRRVDIHGIICHRKQLFFKTSFGKRGKHVY